MSNYPWKRFWCPRSGSIRFDYYGFLWDPEEEFGRTYNPDLVTFEEISKFPCLFLVGEPGIGKTTALESDKDEISDKIHEQGNEILFLNLGQFSSEDRLIRNLFNSWKFKEWLNGTHQLHIFLDSLDECLLQVDTLAVLLIEEFRQYQDQIDRLYLRIACRSAVLPPNLEKGLKEIWGKEAVGVYELVPLRLIDIRQATEAERISTEDFVKKVIEKNIVPFAIKPVTLQFLLAIYCKHGGQFPQKLDQIHVQGCKELCVEQKDKEYHPSNPLSTLEIEQRLIVAARIAAVTVFCNRFAIWTGDQANLPTEDIMQQELCGGNENIKGNPFPITEQVVSEVLDTGLFSARGSSRMGWAHQTYAEFLAAWYLKHHDLKLSQILSLIYNPNGRVIPQLQETAAWLASMRDDVFENVMETDPDVLLQSELANIDETVKASLVDSLLNVHDQGKLAYQYRYRGYEHLNHAGLSTQLKPYISDSKRSVDSRYLAVDIADDCQVQNVQFELANVVLDANQPYELRARAANALVCVGNKKAKAQLKPLAIGNQYDPEDELKGCALLAVYPVHLTTQEFLDSLTQPQANHFGGNYQDFVAKEFAQRLPKNDLPLTLKWLKKQQFTRRKLLHPFDRLSDNILLKAWENLDKPRVLEVFAEVAISRLSSHDYLIQDNYEYSFKELLEKENTKRRKLIEKIILRLPAFENAPYWLVSPRTAIILNKDFDWLIDRLQSVTSEETAKIYAKLVHDLWRYKNNSDSYSREDLNLLLSASEASAILKEELNLEPIVLGSLRAEQAKAGYLKEQQLSELHSDQFPLIQPSPKERVINALNAFEAGSLEAWSSLCLEMTLLPRSQHYDIHQRMQPDITVLPGWQEADNETKLRIIEVAKKYIDQGEPQTDSWLGTNSFNHLAIAGYKALRLVLVKEPTFLSTVITPDVWKKWVAIILDYPKVTKDKENEIRQQLLTRAYQNAPDEFIRVLEILIDQENSQGCLQIQREVRCCWDDRLANVLLDKAKDKKLTARSLGDLLKELLFNQVHEARVFAESFISLPPPASGEKREKAIIASKILLLHADNFNWSLIWNSVQQDYEFGRKVLEAVSYETKFIGSIEQQITEDEIADLYIFLMKQYPDSDFQQQEDSDNEQLQGVGMPPVKPEDSIRTWRDFLPQRLQERGTPEACQALRRIIDELPELSELRDQLQRRLLETEALARRQTWQPLEPKKIIKLVKQMEPSNSDIASQINRVNQGIENMSKEPKYSNISNSNIIDNSKNSNITPRIEPKDGKRVNWSIWIPVLVTVVGIIITANVSGLFNPEIKNWLIEHNLLPDAEEKLDTELDSGKNKSPQAN